MEFHAADAATISQAKKRKQADIIVLDPIRAGCSEKVIDAISEIKPKKLFIFPAMYPPWREI